MRVVSFFRVLLFILQIKVLILAQSSSIYVTPQQSCAGGGCTGDLNLPYDNLLDAFQKASTLQAAAIVLLNNPSVSHYILKDSSSVSLAAGPETTTEYPVNNLVIKPLYCVEEPVLSNPSLLANCIYPGQNITVYLKTVGFRLLVQANMVVQGIIFDAVEDIWPINANGAELRDCIFNRKRCCVAGQTASILYPSIISCDKKNSYPTSLRSYSNSLFSFSQSATTGTSILFQGVGFQNFLSPHLRSLVQTGSKPFNLTFSYVAVDRIYFDKGLISHGDASSPVGSSVSANTSIVIVSDFSFTNYNPWDLVLEDQTRTEGYLLSAEDTFSGSLRVVRGIFQSATSSLRDSCWSQTKAKYQAPMDNLLKTNPRSRSDLWSQIDSEKSNANNYVSSLIYLKALYGAVSISTCSFKNIIGTSGSVIRVDDVISANNWITIYSTMFDENFAYDKFANIMITKKSDPQFSLMLAGLHVEIVGTSFTGARGCPGAYGNVLLLNYWDSSAPPQGSLSSYSLSTQASALMAAWSSTSDSSSFIRVLNSYFINNMLSASNSLAIIGSQFVILDGNIVQGNGGTSAEMAVASLTTSYFGQRYPLRLAALSALSWIHFGQSSAVYFDHVMKIFSRNNVYSGNWGPWEGSLALASALTIKNWLKMSGSLQFSKDYFGDHQGIPSSLASLISDSGLKNNQYTDPIISISVDGAGVTQIVAQLASLKQAVSSAFTAMIGVVIQNNIASYDYRSYTYNPIELQYLTGVLFPSRSYRYQTGLVKLLWPSEALDDFSQGFSNEEANLNKTSLAIVTGLIRNNQLMSSGCLFSSLSILAYVEISFNKIYMKGESFFEPNTPDNPFLLTTPNTKQGLICLQPVETSDQGYSLQLAASYLVVKSNNGIMFNLLSSSIGRNIVNTALHLSNSIFFNNTCVALSTIVVKNNADVISINNIYFNNDNSVGNIFLYMDANATGIFNLYLNNTGKYASLSYVYGASSVKPFEAITRGYYNNVNPKYRVLYSDFLPRAGLYYISSSNFTMLLSMFSQNYAYSGVFTASGSIVYLSYCQISDNNVTGNSILGTFMSLSTLVMTNSQLKNNIINKEDPDSQNRPSLVVFFTAIFYAQNIEISSGTAVGDTYIMFANAVNAVIANLLVKDFHCTKPNNKNPLIQLTFSSLNLIGFQSSNTTGLFSFITSVANISYAEITDIKNAYRTQFIFNMYSTTLGISNIKYVGNGEYESTLSLVGGDQNWITMTSCEFVNASGGESSLFSLTTSGAVRAARCKFTFSKELGYVTVFDLSNSENVAIQENIFSFAGRVLKAAGLTRRFSFYNNIILSFSHMQNVYLEDMNLALLSFNMFVAEKSDEEISLPGSQMQIVDSVLPNTVQENLFFSMYGGSGVLEVDSDQVNTQSGILSNIFISNMGSTGGGIYLKAQRIKAGQTLQTLIQNCIFVGNQAVTGGAIYQTTPNQVPQNTQVTSSVFISNSGEDYGGAIFFDYSPPEVDANSFFNNNSARNILNHIGSYAVRLGFVKAQNTQAVYIPGSPMPQFENEEKFSNWGEVGSGVVNYKTFKIGLYDMYGQLVFNDGSSTLELFPDGGFDSSNKKDFSADYSLQASGGIFTITNFTYNYKVGETLNVTYKTNAIPKWSSPPVVSLTFVPSIKAELYFRQCEEGEFTSVKNGRTTCESCPVGFWYVNPYKTTLSCDACDPTSTMCLGGNNVGPREGFWRMSETADIVLACLRSESCLGNPDSDSTSKITLDHTGSCAAHYRGNLCSNCIDGWAKGSEGDCVDCHTNVISYLLLFGMMIMQAVTIGMGVKETMKSGEEYSDKEDVESNSASLIRIFINYSQMFSMLVGIPIAWPSTGAQGSFVNISSRISAISNQLFTLDCFFLVLKSFMEIATVFIKALLTVFNPVIFGILAATFWIIYFKYKKRRVFKNKDFFNQLMTTLVIIGFDMQPAIIQSGFSLFQCENLYRNDTPMNYLVLDYDIRCWEGSHIKWILALVIPSLLVWIFLLPGLVLYILNKNKEKLHTEEMIKKYSFIYNGYKIKKFYWEFVIMVRKILMICATVFAGFNSSNMQIYLFLALILISYTFHMYHQPYSAELLNDLEKVGLVSLTVVSFGGLYFQIISGTGGLTKIVIAISFIAYLYFLLNFVRLYFALYIKQLQENKRLMKIIKWVDAKFCCCLRNPRIQRSLTRLKTKIYPNPISKALIPELQQQQHTSSVVHETDVGRSMLTQKDLLQITTERIEEPKIPTVNEIANDFSEDSPRNDNSFTISGGPIGGGGDFLLSRPRDRKRNKKININLSETMGNDPMMTLDENSKIEVREENSTNT